jgi:hypothetical protein
VHWFNDLHDKPRALGVPKAILVDSTITPAPVSSPSTWAAQAPYNFNVYGINSPGVGWTPGTYRFAITYYDDFTGEEGLPSEEVSITVPSSGTGGHSYGIQLTYFHPGYLYPEILTLSLNIYFASNTVEPLGFYKRVPLQVGPISTPNASSKYGFTAGGSPEATVPQQTLYQTFQLQPPLNSSPYSSARDTSRLAPQSLQMPKGAECFRVIRGIPLSVGHTGTHGLVGELTGAKSSAILDPSTPVLRTAENEVIVRFSNSPSVDLVGATLDGPFGLASRVFPPAYEGVGLFSSELYPAPRQLLFVDRVLNCKTHNTNSVLERHQAYEQRLRMDESVFDKDKGDAGSPFRQTRNFKQVYLEEPKTQVQVGEPGRPEVAIATAIQIIDPNRDDDGFAIGNLGGQAIICTKEETFSLAWARAPQGNVPQSVTNEHGCVGTNSMTQFDGGLCWLGKRGPCAMMPQFDFVGADLEHDFTGSKRRYLSDSRGFMRHAWSCHDRSRGLVLWGLVTTQATHTINWHGTAVTFSAAPDQAKSRFPCDEVLIWSYRAQAFSRWRPPSGMEIFWMRPVKDKNGDERLSFLAADNRIYAFDEEWNDTNRSLFQSSITGIGNASTVLTTVSSFAVDGNGGATARGTGDNLVRVGMSVLIFDSEGQVVAKTTVAAATAPNTITLTAASSWGFGATLEIGHRSDLRVVTTFAGDSADNLEVESVQARYALAGEGLRAWAQVQVNKSDLRDASQTTDYSQEPSVWKKLGIAEDTLYGARRTLAEGRTVAPEIAVDVTFTGGAQVRLTDLAVDVKSGS